MKKTLVRHTVVDSAIVYVALAESGVAIAGAVTLLILFAVFGVIEDGKP